MDIDYYKLNSFCDKSPGGNPAGVLLRADFSDFEMKEIASKQGLNEPCVC